MAGAAGSEERGGPFSVPGGPAAVLVLHGFTGVPMSMRPPAEAFADAGFGVELPRLPGHGTTPEDLAERGFEDWYATAEAAYLELAAAHERVVAVGMSMGGTLACALATNHPELAGLILINPFIEPHPDSFVELLGQMLSSGARSIPSIGSDINRPGVSGGGYGETPIAPLLSLVEAVRALAPRLGGITCPVLLFSSRVDHVVPTSTGDYFESKVAGPLERVHLEHSFHVATLDQDAAELEARAVAFAQKVTAS